MRENLKNKRIMEKDTTMKDAGFILSKVKLLPEGGLTANYKSTETTGGEPSVLDYQTTCTREIHPDMQARFNGLREVVARTLNITAFLSLLENLKITAGEKEYVKEFAADLVEKIDVRGIAISGAADLRGVVITAVLETPNGLKTYVNTPRIKLGGDSFGFEEDLAAAVDAICSEVYEYLFNGKQAQLSLFGGDGEPLTDKQVLEEEQNLL